MLDHGISGFCNLNQVPSAYIFSSRVTKSTIYPQSTIYSIMPVKGTCLCGQTTINLDITLDATSYPHVTILSNFTLCNAYQILSDRLSLPRLSTYQWQRVQQQHHRPRDSCKY